MSLGSIKAREKPPSWMTASLGGGKAADAERLFQSCVTGVHATDHALMLGLARAQFELKDYAGACETLDRLRAAHPVSTVRMAICSTRAARSSKEISSRH